MPGQDVAGTVDEIGPGTVTDLAYGDPVIAMVLPFLPRPDGTADYFGGGYAKHVVLPAGSVTRAPRDVDHATASALPLNGLIALLNLDQLALEPGAVLAVTGAAGAVGRLCGADGRGGRPRRDRRRCPRRRDHGA
ncbi:hypothetical protein [Micromonospora sp. NPDC005171]|uniref:alcohol dehydrogenase catalytic domain-containing protein n=1 Tax=Micromonospora sp. NPDC005171 TaxID=3156866 RepID=UPI0033A2DBCF